MVTSHEWQYDEFRHCGVDYDDPAAADGYDAQHGRFRGDMAAAADALLDELGVAEGKTLLDVGCGTGIFAVQAARRCRMVYAVDVSAAMLGIAQRRADDAGVRNIAFRRGGFLTYGHDAPPVDVIASTAALHHLPDVWKLIGLQCLAGMLADDGLFYLMDTVYAFAPEEYVAFFDGQVAWFREHAGDAFAREAVTAIRDEYSTCDWIMEGLLQRAGFAIERAESRGFLARYFCRKRARAG